MESQPEMLNERNRIIRGVCVGVVPRGQSNISRALDAHRGKKLLQDLQTLDNATIKRSILWIKEEKEKSARTSMEYLEVFQKYNTRLRPPCGRRPSAEAWNRMTRRDLFVGCVMTVVSGKKPPVSTLYHAQTGWSSLIDN